jgi:hypothetical protein
MPIEDSFKINLNQNLWGLGVAIVSSPIGTKPHSVW